MLLLHMRRHGLLDTMHHNAHTFSVNAMLLCPSSQLGIIQVTHTLAHSEAGSHSSSQSGSPSQPLQDLHVPQ